MAYQPVTHGKRDYAETRITVKHEEIRRWVEQHGGQPVRVRGNLDPDETGLLRLQVPGTKQLRNHEPIERIGWDEFFRNFDHHRLAMLYRNEVEEPGKGAFCKLVHRGNLHA